MLDWLQSFGNFFTSLGDFLVSFFRNVIEIVQLVFKGFAYIMQILAFMPVQYQAVLIAFISFSVIVTIIHFGG